MKTIVPSALFWAVLTVSILISGCEESNLTSQRRARLVGDENLKLKKQLKPCNQKIQELKEIIAEYEREDQKEYDAQRETSGLTLKLMKNLTDSTKKIEKLTDENLQLKTRIQELESKLTQNTNRPDSQ
jgi:cell division septum initiation protein DivIVA